MYPEELVAPMRKDLTDFDFEELKTGAEVKSTLNKKGTLLMVINSVCGCSAGSARPGVKMSLKHTVKPTHLATVFAGVDVDAVDIARKHMLPFPPSSPCIALFKDGELVHMLERHHIEGHSAEMIADNLMEAYSEHCN